MGMTLAAYAKAGYFKVMDLLHLPFVKRGLKDPYHVLFEEFVSIGQSMPAPAVLEIGSRNVSGIMRRDIFPHCSEYVGLDILPGEGVDIVGDVHRLSEACPDHHFDLVYGISVFEHLLFPWKAVLEINRVMKPGGYIHVSSHPAWPAHELPWDFWRYQSNGFHALFNKYTGFEIVSLAEGLPCKVYSLVDDIPTRGLWAFTVNLGVAVIARKTGDYRSDLLKWDMEVSDAIETMYPSPPSNKR